MLRCFTALILLIALGAGVMVYRVLSTPPPPTPVVATSRDAAVSFDQKVDSFQKTATNESKRKVELTLTQKEIASKVKESLTSRGGSDFRDVAVQLKSGGVVIAGVATVGGMDVPVQADARLFASGRMLGVEVTSMKTGNLDLPQPVMNQLIALAQQSTGLKSLDKIDVGIEVETVDTTPERVRIMGQTR